MIVTVTLNPALDIGYTVDELVPTGSHRVRVVTERAGGKGVNVARLLAASGAEVVATGLLGGATGERVRSDLNDRGVDHDFVPVAGESRRTVNVTATLEGHATIFNEPGPHVSAAELQRLRHHLTRLVETRGARVVVFSGSLPPGIPDDAYASLAHVCKAAGATTVVDATGAALRHAVASGGVDVVKPNLVELGEATGDTDAGRGALALQALGARDVVVSQGPDGLLALTRAGHVHRAHRPGRLAGNPTGAGDAVVAALAGRLERTTPAELDWTAALVEAVAWSAAAVLQPDAGTIDPHDAARLAPEVLTEVS